MASIFDDLKYTYRSGSTVTRFILLNVGVFVLLNLIRVAGFFFKSRFLDAVLPWVAGSSGWETMLYKPWTMITYMFVHLGLWHILGNMLILYFSGRIFEDLLNARRFIAVYFLGGISGFLLYFISFNVFPVFEGTQSIIYGASASVIAVLVAIATYTPNLEVRLILIGNVKLKYIAIFFVALDILFLDGGNTGGRLAHLGGAIFGFSYSKSLQNGNDWSKGFYAFTNFFRDLIKPRPKMKVASSSSRKRPAPKTGSPKSKEEVSNQKKIDAILDKISQSGYDSLSKEEKEFLFNASKK